MELASHAAVFCTLLLGKWGEEAELARQRQQSATIFTVFSALTLSVNCACLLLFVVLQGVVFLERTQKKAKTKKRINSLRRATKR